MKELVHNLCGQVLKWTMALSEGVVSSHSLFPSHIDSLPYPDSFLAPMDRPTFLWV